MKANELRIGNLVERLDGELHQILGHDIFHYDKFKEDFRSTFQPITLTEEWLIRFGFEKLWYDDNGLKLPYYRFNNLDYIFDLDYEFCYTREDGNYIRVKSIHQLQNLYFALTGEELELIN